MHDLLFDDDFTSIRRRPTDIAGWPELERILYPVTLNAQQRSMYEDAWNFVKTAVKEDRKLRESGKPRHSQVSDKLNPLTALLRYRQVGSKIRLASTIAAAEDLLANGQQVAISAEFRDDVDELIEAFSKKRIPATAIHGGMAPEEREENRLSFQTGESKVIVFTVKEGISLHAGEDLIVDGHKMKGSTAPRSTIVHTVRFSSLDCVQIEGRTWQRPRLTLLLLLRRRHRRRESRQNHVRQNDRHENNAC